MAGILVKIAKELNVGTQTIVDFLSSKNFSIENKPNAKVSDEMYEYLRKEFKGSADIKEKADQIQIGATFKKVDEKPSFAPPKSDLFSAPKLDFQAPPKEPQKPVAPPPPPPPVVVEPPVVEVVENVPAVPTEPEVEDKVNIPESEVSTPVPTEVPTTPEIITTSSSDLPGLKILGKIDLESRKKPAKTAVKNTKPESNEAPVPAEPTAPIDEAAPSQDAPNTPLQESKVEKPTQDDAAPQTNVSELEAPEEQQEYRAETPQLAGLKILGKIDTSKLNPSSKPVKKEKPAPQQNQKQSSEKPKEGAAPRVIKDFVRKVDRIAAAGTSTSGADGDKKKRKRKKVPVTAVPGQINPRGRNDKEAAPKEVTQKEIDDKIKATMARLNTSTKNKRQKIRRDNRETKREKQELQNMESAETKLKLTEFVSVSELASLMDLPVTDVITTCMSLGVMVSINQRLDAEIIELVCEEYGFEVEFVNAEDQLEEVIEVEDSPEDLIERAPIVTVMGHVDHGKTSLLDYIRKANVASGEAGGITQHIGAYEVMVHGKKITFLDTPGHEAFTAMRARGAKVTDVVIVIIAADDQIMPQTKEAISHAQAAGVPIVFAINKIDKPGADPERIKSELANMNLLVEDWGGTYQSQDISAKNGINIEPLLEKILLQAEILDLKANPNRKALGTVIEASLDKGKGYVTKVLVQNGTLNIGDPLVCGSYSGKVKAMFNEKGARIKSAGPATPVLVLGLSGAPQAGDKFKVMDSEQEARQLALKRNQIDREQANRAAKRISLDEIGRRLALGNFKELNLIVKGDVDGSIEALSDSLIKLSVESIQVNVIHKAVGAIAESDVLLASASDAIIIGFQVRPSAGARALAEKEGVEIKTYSIIYEAIEQIKAAMEGMLDTIKEEKVVGSAVVRETFKISKIGTIAGCFVTEGKISRNSKIRVIRDGFVVFPKQEGALGELTSLKRFKDDVKEVKNNFECGIMIKNYNDIHTDDIIECYEIIETKQKLA